MHLSFSIGYLLLAATPAPFPSGAPGPVQVGGNIVALASAMIAFTTNVLLLGLIAGTVVFVAEENGGRFWINRLLVDGWVRSSYRLAKKDSPREPAADAKDAAKLLARLSRQWYSLPYKQLAGAIATAFGASEIRDTKYVARDLTFYFAEIGRRVLQVEPTPEPPRQPPSREPSAGQPVTDASSAAAAERVYFAERALDNLQARLSAKWIYIRFVAGFVVSVLVCGAVAHFHTRQTLDFVASVVTYALIWLIASVFAPVFRDLVESLTRTRA